MPVEPTPLRAVRARGRAARKAWSYRAPRARSLFTNRQPRPWAHRVLPVVAATVLAEAPMVGVVASGAGRAVMTRVSWFCVGALVPSMLLAAIILAGVAQYMLGAAFAAMLPVARVRVASLARSLRTALRSAPAPAPAPTAPVLAARLSHA